MKLTQTQKNNRIFDTGLQGRSSTKNRDMISNLLKEHGFENAGCYSLSARFAWEKNTKGWKVSWGERCNISGKTGTKYFSLVRYFKSEKDVIAFLENKIKN